MTEHIENTLKTIPKKPGIYKYFNKKWEIIYVWKSVNLFSRVHSYFNGKSKLNFAKKKMVTQIENIETIIVENETESLLLETSLIKEHKPKYNILMKDDKNHMYIKITSDTYPKIVKTRLSPSNTSVIRWRKNGTYFGPYISTWHVNNILHIIKKYFWYWCYNINFFKEWSGYNLDKYLFKNNVAEKNNILTQEEIRAEYLAQIEQIKHFLKWNYREVIESLQEKMLQFAKNMQFEEAQKTKEQIESLQSLDISQNVRDKIIWNYDIVHFIEKFEHFYIWLLEIRESKIIGYNTYEVKAQLEETPVEILQNFIEQRFALHKTNNEKISFIIPQEISEVYSEIEIEVPKIGPKKDILMMAYKNAYEHAYKKHLDSLSTKGFTKWTMQNLLKILGYNEINKSLIFECNDISHYSGSHTVASRSIIENGKSNTSKYKKFKIKTLEENKIDDFWSMREVMTRRIKEIEKTWVLPDLIIIDGWKWQLWSVMEIIEDAKNTSQDENFKKLIENLQLVSIAKQEEELFLPGESQSILLEKDSLELRLTQKIRDEAHRFAITFNRDKRLKAMKKNILESLPGFGPVTRKKILNKYWNVEKLSEISLNEISEILNKNQIQTLQDHGLYPD